MKKYFSLGLFVMIIATIALYIVFLFNPSLAFEIYTSGVFRLIRSSFNVVSLPVIFIIWSIILFAYFRHRTSENAHRSLFNWLKFLVKPILWCLVIFYWMWGFNYMSPGPETKMLGKGIEPTKDDLITAFQQHTMRLVELRDSLTLTDSIDNRTLVATHNDQWTTSVRNVLKPAGYNVKGNTELIMSWPKGFLLRFGTAGFYNFVLSRPTIDPGLHPLQVPFTSLHELAHAYGVADEASANFIGYVASYDTGDAMTEYSAELSFWRTLRAACYRQDSVATKTIMQFITRDVRRDLIAIRKQMDRYPDLVPELRDTFYDLFLKSQGVEEGMMSYDLYVPLVLQWEAEKNLKDNR